ncbi:hypothetical protein PTQ21_00010 [Paenibacillus marchantiae]|nr:hypothetical protein [Paenibacillus marchantiae]WDQ32795.1 hypothetical protein PTQ21_00010 [Paenibacillus marchantiae]
MDTGKFYLLPRLLRELEQTPVALVAKVHPYRRVILLQADDL